MVHSMTEDEGACLTHIVVPQSCLLTTGSGLVQLLFRIGSQQKWQHLRSICKPQSCMCHSLQIHAHHSYPTAAGSNMPNRNARSNSCVVISHRSLVIGHRSSVIGHRSAVSDHRSSVINHKPFMNSNGATLCCHHVSSVMGQQIRLVL